MELKHDLTIESVSKKQNRVFKAYSRIRKVEKNVKKEKEASKKNLLSVFVTYDREFIWKEWNSVRNY